MGIPKEVKEKKKGFCETTKQNNGPKISSS